MHHPAPSTASAYQSALTFTRVDSASGQSAKGKFKSRQIVSSSQAQQLIRSEEKLSQLRQQLHLLEKKFAACLDQQAPSSVGQNHQRSETYATITPVHASSTLQVPQASTLSSSNAASPSATPRPGNSMADTTTTGNVTSATIAPLSQFATGNDQQLANITQSLTDSAGTITRLFNEGIAETCNRTLTQIRQLATADQEQRSIQKRIALGDGLNSIKRQFSHHFLDIYQLAHNASQSVRSIASDDDQITLPASARITSTLISSFENMYTIMENLRLQLFADANYIDSNWLTGEGSRQQEAADHDDHGKDTFAGDSLVKAIKQHPASQSSDSFDRFIGDMGLLLENQDKVRQLHQAETESATLSPVARQQEQRLAAAMTFTRGEISRALVANPDRVRSEQVLTDILQREKGLFIDALQQIYLNHKGQFTDEITRAEAGQDVLFLPSTFLDVIKDPDGYRAALPNPVNPQPANSRNQSLLRKRRDLSGQSAVSGANQHKGMLAGALQSLGQLAGYLNPLSLRGSAPPGISGNLQARSNAILTPADYPVAGTLLLANLLAAKVSGRPLAHQRQAAAADNSQGTTLIEQQLTSTSPLDHQPAETTLIKELSSGNYDEAQSGFMQLPLSEQLELLASLGKQPDHQGLDSFSGSLAQLQIDVRNLATAHTGENASRTSDWQSCRLSQRAWQLFTHLYDTRVEALGEAINQQKITERITHEGIEPNQDNAHYLGQLVVQLLPNRTSASERASQIATGTEALPTVARLHRFTHQGINDILSSYSAIKSLASEQFPQVFGNTVSDPQLKGELIAQIARTSLQELRGKTTGDGWQQVVRDNTLAEFEEWL
ncbi:hypothetical protein [Endozoicomonas sp. SCSIO W0465]|uniref:hypothetical protein n=1 Tax=Endozoicomonas sp. SCSIO W0465 TaxID=2918516 RepID=UPI002076362D|nr:hypothetical protein [Endozoicomonas sp. SCSIO W0465]USE37125.1 hypothetical protein MJO57_02520 [Endozoicomonas sp. SCSIO W0465]